jgi:rSAM/selenodomain-associated transferase 1
MSHAMREPVAIAILAKAPVPGFAKTRLIPELGAHGAAALQEAMTERTVETACASAIGPVTLWCAPSETHVSFRDLAARFPLSLARQPDGDLGHRMLTAATAAPAPVVVIGTDCPALAAAHLQDAAAALRQGADVVILPVEDGGYALIGTATPQPLLFEAMPWSTAEVTPETRRRLAAAGLTWRELPPLWDVDVPADLDRLPSVGLQHLVG